MLDAPWSLNTLRVLNGLLAGKESVRELAGDGHRATADRVLRRLATEGVVTFRWEDGDPRDIGRPRRRLYRLTDEGERRARELLAAAAATLSAEGRSA